MNNRLLPEDIKNVIVSEEFTLMGKKTTVGLFTLENGFEIVTSSSCVDPANYDEGIGQRICRERATDKIWELEGYALQKRIHEEEIYGSDD